jgi:hypothetical protein
MEGQQSLVFFLGGIPSLSPIGARQFAAAQPVTGQQAMPMTPRCSPR